MESKATRLQFALRFAQMDLADLRPGDWLNLQDDLATFLGMGRAGHAAGEICAYVSAPPAPDEYTPADFQALQQEARQVLESVLGTPGVKDFCGHAIAVQMSLAGDRKARGYALQLVGATSDVFLSLLFLLISREPAGKILRCPECQIIFYRIRKQQYCSRACTNRKNIRTWRHRGDTT